MVQGESCTVLNIGHHQIQEGQRLASRVTGTEITNFLVLPIQSVQQLIVYTQSK